MRLQRFSRERHKAACLSLYRSLLRHTSHLPLPPALRSTTYNLIRTTFHTNRTLQGVPLIHRALSTGYTDELLLRSTISPSSPTLPALTTRLTTLLNHRKSQLLRSRLSSRPLPPPGTPAPPTRSKKVLNLALTPSEKAARSAEIRRRPPIMHTVAGMPVLHFPGRPQSPKVSRILGRMIKLKQNCMDAINYYEKDGIWIAEGEDHWERQLTEHCARYGYVGEVRDKEKEKGERTWKSWAIAMRDGVNEWYQNTRLENKKKADELQEIIDRETREYEESKRVKVRERRRRERRRRVLWGKVKKGEIDEAEFKKRIQELYGHEESDKAVPGAIKPKPKSKTTTSAWDVAETETSTGDVTETPKPAIPEPTTTKPTAPKPLAKVVHPALVPPKYVPKLTETKKLEEPTPRFTVRRLQTTFPSPSRSPSQHRIPDQQLAEKPVFRRISHTPHNESPSIMFRPRTTRLPTLEKSMRKPVKRCAKCQEMGHDAEACKN